VLHRHVLGGSEEKQGYLHSQMSVSWPRPLKYEGGITMASYQIDRHIRCQTNSIRWGETAYRAVSQYV